MILLLRHLIFLAFEYLVFLVLDRITLVDLTFSTSHKKYTCFFFHKLDCIFQKTFLFNEKKIPLLVNKTKLGLEFLFLVIIILLEINNIVSILITLFLFLPKLS